MMLGPVFRVELLGLGRRGRYYWLRGVYIVGLLFALWLCYLETFGAHAWYGDADLAAYAELAEYFFAAFTGIQLGAILLLTPATVAGAIAGEHERRPIDYLLTRDRAGQVCRPDADVGLPTACRSAGAGAGHAVGRHRTGDAGQGVRLFGIGAGGHGGAVVVDFGREHA
jgi:hypothetical protein